MSATATDTPVESEDAAPDDVSAEPDAETEQPPQGRQAGYRQRAQAAEARVAEIEAETAAQATKIEGLQKMLVDKAVEASGLKPAAVFAVAELGALLDENGLPDPEKIDAAVAAAKESLGVVGLLPGPTRQTGMRSGAGYSPPKRDSWADAFAPKDKN